MDRASIKPCPLKPCEVRTNCGVGTKFRQGRIALNMWVRVDKLEHPDMTKRGRTLSKKYRIGRIIGDGEFSAVYEATSIEDGYKCAIKKLYNMDEEDDLDRFKKEIQIQSHIKHDNLVPIIDYNPDARQAWYVMPGALYSLQDHLKNSYGEKCLTS